MRHSVVGSARRRGGHDPPRPSNLEFAIEAYSDEAHRALRQGSWGAPQAEAFRSDRIYAIQLQVHPSTTADVWVDDIGFVRK